MPDTVTDHASLMPALTVAAAQPIVHAIWTRPDADRLILTHCIVKEIYKLAFIGSPILHLRKLRLKDIK